MKVILALAFLAVATADLQPIQLPEPVVPFVEQYEDIPAEPVKLVESSDASDFEPIQLVDAPNPEFMQMIDISPAIVPEEVMRQVAAMNSRADMAEDVQAPEPIVLDSEYFMYLQAPENEDPTRVMVVESADEAFPAFQNIAPSELESIRVVDAPVFDDDSVRVADAPGPEFQPGYPPKWADPTWR